MTLIAVTQRTQIIAEYDETRDCLDQRWHDFLLACNITPLIIPNNLEVAKKIINSVNFEGVLLTGGNNTLSREITEKLLLEFAIQRKLPVLGICHGMQFIQNYFGDKLEKISGHILEKQEILINGVRETVNSYHNYGTLNASSEFTVWARADDGVIKAIRHQLLPITGIMWHPERYEKFKLKDITLFKEILTMRDE